MRSIGGAQAARNGRTTICSFPRFRTMAGMVAVCAVPLLAGGLPSTAGAHHSFAMFDQERTIVISGEVREFQWVNPHTWIQLVANEGGRTVEWSIEGRSPNVLSRRGWTRVSLKPGDRIAATIHPLKSGKPGGAIVSIRFADGRVLNADTPEAVDTNEEGPR